MSYSDKIFGLMLVALAGVCAYACVPQNQFPSPGKRLRVGLIFFALFVGGMALYSWDKVSTLWE